MQDICQANYAAFESDDVAVISLWEDENEECEIAGIIKMHFYLEIET